MFRWGRRSFCVACQRSPKAADHQVRWSAPPVPGGRRHKSNAGHTTNRCCRAHTVLPTRTCLSPRDRGSGGKHVGLDRGRWRRATTFGSYRRMVKPGASPYACHPSPATRIPKRTPTKPNRSGARNLRRSASRWQSAFRNGDRNLPRDSETEAGPADQGWLFGGSPGNKSMPRSESAVGTARTARLTASTQGIRRLAIFADP